MNPTPDHSYALPTLIPARNPARITLERAEGTQEECIKVEVTTWEDARRILLQWALTAPDKGGYNKCDVRVLWADGFRWALRYDLQRSSTGDLCCEAVVEAMFYLGDYCSAHMTLRRYQEFLASNVGVEERMFYATLKSRCQGTWED